MRRIIVAGGTGFFGGAAVERLRADGCEPIIASRTGGMRLDVEDRGSIGTLLRQGDVVLDAVGPFQDRTTTLVQAAEAIGFDVVDISDSLTYCERVLARRSAGVRLLTACSSVSVVPASCVMVSGITRPTRASTFLAPETRYTARPGAGTSLLRSIGRPIRVWRGGALVRRIGWSEAQPFPMPRPIGPLECRLMETADAVTLPPVWPSLRDVDFWVDTHIAALNRLLTWAAGWGVASWFESRYVQRIGLPVVRGLGPKGGAMGVQIEGEGRIARFGIVAEHRGYYTPIVPAVIAAKRIAEGRFQGTGVIPADRQVDPEEVFAYLRAIGLRVLRLD